MKSRRKRQTARISSQCMEPTLVCLALCLFLSIRCLHVSHAVPTNPPLATRLRHRQTAGNMYLVPLLPVSPTIFISSSSMVYALRGKRLPWLRRGTTPTLYSITSSDSTLCPFFFLWSELINGWPGLNRDAHNTI